MRISFNGKDAKEEITPEEVLDKLNNVGVVNMLECYRYFPDKYLMAVARDENYMLFYKDEEKHEICLDFPTFKELKKIIELYSKNENFKAIFPNWETIKEEKQNEKI